MLHPEGPVSNPYLSMKPLPPPAIAHACREAYYFSRERYHQLSFEAVSLRGNIYDLNSHHEQHGTLPHFHTWFNPDRDVLFIDIAQDQDAPIERWALPFLNIYSPSRDMPGYGFSIFSQFIRRIWPFTTIAKHVLLHQTEYDILNLLIYVFSDAFPLLQQISYVTYLFQWSHTSPKPNAILSHEDSALLVDINNKAQTDLVTSMLEADKLVDSTRGEIARKRCLNNTSRNHQNIRSGPRVQSGSLAKEVLKRLRLDLAKSQIYADTAYSINEKGDRVYETFWTWEELSNTPPLKSEIAARQEQAPTIRAACLVMKPAWTIQIIALDPQKPSDTTPHWVRQ